MAERKIWRRRRTTERVATRLSVRLRGTMSDIECTALDVSDTGTRLRILLRDVGLDRETGLFDLSRVVTMAFGDGCSAEFRHPRGSEGVRKDLALVRIGLLRKQAADFEVGCRFESALTEEEWRALGLPASASGSTSAAAQARDAG
jgi:hypothetical protein